MEIILLFKPPVMIALIVKYARDLIRLDNVFLTCYIHCAGKFYGIYVFILNRK